MIYRHKCGRGFTYLREDGTRLRGDNGADKKVRKWIDSLAIPPAWREVEITEDSSEKIYAFGRDVKGKKQYIYNPNWAAKQQKLKFDRLRLFAERLSAMRTTTSKHLKKTAMCRERVLACMLRLLDVAYFRPGNPQYTKENESFGLTTMRSRHLCIEGGELVFRYRGKSSVEQEKIIDNPLLVKVVAELDELPGYRIFKYIDDNGNKVFVNSDDLNEYIRSIMGEEFSAKDFRTWAGTALAAVHFGEIGVAHDERSKKKNIVDCVKFVAQKLGNTPAISRANYIAPPIISHYEAGRCIQDFNPLKIKTISQLSKNERRVAAMLDSKK